MRLKRADDTSAHSREPHVRLLPLTRPLPNKGGCRTGPCLWKMLWRARLRFPCGYSLRHEQKRSALPPNRERDGSRSAEEDRARVGRDAILMKRAELLSARPFSIDDIEQHQRFNNLGRGQCFAVRCGQF
jgi:hypothetical protein